MKPGNKNVIDEILNEEAFFLQQKQGNMNTFILDDDQGELLNKLLTLNRLDPVTRENYTKHLSVCIRSLGQKGSENLLKILDNYKNESEKMQMLFLEQIATIFEQEMNSGNLIINVLSHYLLNCSLRIKELAGKQISKIAQHMPDDEKKGNQLLPIIIKMAHDDANEENRTVALQLFGRLAKIFGNQLCESFIAQEILSKGEDPKEMVRIESIRQLPEISKLVSQDFFLKKLLPFYLKKCKDSKQKIKQQCCDIFLSMTDLSTPQSKQQELSNQILVFQMDSIKQIKGVAYRQLGRFIAQLEGDKMDPRLFDNYLRMADSDIKDLLPDFQVMFACAFSFPAVLLTVTCKKWPQMLKLFNLLWKSKDERVRKTLAASLHEVAKLIGPEQSEKDLFPVLENIFVKEPNDVVLMGCVKNLSQFLQIFSNEKKEQLLEIFLFIQKDKKKWRIREQIAGQIDKMAEIFPPEIIFKMIIPISFKLCTDDVAHVRKIASEKIQSLVQVMDGTPFLECVIQNMYGFLSSKVYYQRQGYIYMCDKLMNSSNTVFEQYLLEGLLQLAQDKVKNVKFILAQTLQRHVQNDGKFSKDSRIINTLNQLSQDIELNKLLQINQINHINQIKQVQIEGQAEEESQQQQDDINQEESGDYLIPKDVLVQDVNEDEIPERNVQQDS